MKIMKLHPEAKSPTRAHSTDAGLDLYALESVFIPVGGTAKIQTGIAVGIPEGYVGKIEDRSSMATKGLRTGGGVVDCGYTGDVTVVLHNLNNRHHYFPQYGGEAGYQVNAGEKIAQLLVYQVNLDAVEVVESLVNSDRSQNGFGSTGN